MRVEDRAGRRWRVRRRWLPWRRRIREVPDTPDTLVQLGDDPISAIIGIFLLILAIPAFIVILLLLAELLLLLVLLPIFIVVRLLLPVPWTVELWSRPAERRVLGWHLEHEVGVTGWVASRARLQALARDVAALGPRDGDWAPEDRTGPPPSRGGGTPPSIESWGTFERGDGPPRRSRPAATPPGAPDVPTAPERRASDLPAPPNPFAQRGED